MHICRMHPLGLTLWEDFVEVEGTHLQQYLTTEKVLLASRVHVRYYKGILTIELMYFSFITFV